MPRASQPDLGRAVLVPVFAALVALNVVRLQGDDRQSPLTVLGTVAALTFYAVLTVMYLRRGPASDTDRRPEVWLAAGAATFSPFLIPLVGPGAPKTVGAGLGSSLVAAGICLSTWALLHLRTNISVVPQSRELATTGPYGLFRHPLYVFEYLSAIGLALLAGGEWAWLVLVVLGVLQVLRARWEEHLLDEQIPEYAHYRSTTRGFS